MARPPLALGPHGSVTASREDGRWVARCRVRDLDGKTRKVERWGSSRAAAQRALQDELRTRHGERVEVLRRESRFRDAAEVWRNKIAEGRVLLARADQALVNATLSGPLERFTPRTIVDPGELRRELAKIRKSGYAISDRQVELVSTSVAAPIRGPGAAGVVAAISIIVLAGNTDVRRFVPAVLTAARGISRALGAASTPGDSPRSRS